MLATEQIALLTQLASDVVCRKISQKKIAADTGVHQSQISRILSGQVKRASRNVQTLCNYAKARLDEGPAAVAEVPDKNVFEHFFGHSLSEDVAFKEVLSSLARWRESWRSAPA